MINENIITLIANDTGLSVKAVGNTIELLEEGCTIPFIARYRKERTGGLSEVEIARISQLNDKYKELAKRKETIIATIEGQDKMTDELRSKIDATWDSQILEDLYLPYKPRRRTRAQVAREHGLEPLANIIMLQRDRDPRKQAERFINTEVEDIDAAIQGACDIIAERISEDSQARQTVRRVFQHTAYIQSKVIKKMAGEDKAQKFSDYFDFSEQLRRCSSHRMLAMRRGESEGVLRVSITADDDESLTKLRRQFVKGYGECQSIVSRALDDGYDRLLRPSIETEFFGQSKEKADDEAIEVFSENLRQLLLAAPLGQKRVLGIDPGFRTGCKVVCLDEMGNLLHHDVIYPHPPKNDHFNAQRTLERLVKEYHIEAIAIGNGTASRETDEFVGYINFDHEVKKFVVSEDGASVYSASEVAREEFPDEDVTVRGAVSIGRRLMDPLAELVKIDPKSIGVGQYQHDVDQGKLKRSLDQTVELCVNTVGVNVNTASKNLLTYVSGLGPVLAKNIVEHRRKNGPFRSRRELMKVTRLGPAAYQQCAGFLRIPEADNPLDNSAVHPESYPIVERMAKDAGCDVKTLMRESSRRQGIDIKKYVTEEVGIPTLTDIMKELDKPGLDPRDKIEEFAFDPNVHTPEDLQEGMILPGIVTNITNFGAFVDIGVHQDGLVHISQLANKFIKDPNDVVKLHQHVMVRVVEVDFRRNRISLSMKNV